MILKKKLEEIIKEFKDEETKKELRNDPLIKYSSGFVIYMCIYNGLHYICVELLWDLIQPILIIIAIIMLGIAYSDYPTVKERRRKKEMMDPNYMDWSGTMGIIRMGWTVWSVRYQRYVTMDVDDEGERVFRDGDEIVERYEDIKHTVRTEGVVDDPRLTVIPIGRYIVKDKATGRYMGCCIYNKTRYYMDLKTGDCVRLSDIHRLRLDSATDEQRANIERDFKIKRGHVKKLHQQMLADTPEKLRDQKFWDKYITAGHSRTDSQSLDLERWVVKPIQKNKSTTPT